MDYATYQREHLAGPLRVREFREVRSQARGAAEERRAVAERQSSGESRVRRGSSRPVRGGPPELSWKIAVVDFQGNPAELHLALARVEPAPITMPVPNEWVNEAVRRMLALENVVRRAASGLPLDLRYPPPAAQRSQAQGQAAPRRKSAKDPPQKKLAARTSTPPLTTRLQMRGLQPPATSEEAAREAKALAEER